MKSYTDFEGKIVAVRGQGSGINVGRCVGIGPNWIILEAGSFYCQKWTFNKGFGSFHSLANNNIASGEHICEVTKDACIFSQEHVIECDPALMTTLKKYSTK